jgi:hypothetical protein
MQGCGAEYEIKLFMYVSCCFGPLEVAYDYNALRRTVTRESIQQGHTQFGVIVLSYPSPQITH